MLHLRWLLLSISFCCCLASIQAQQAFNRTIRFDEGWRFFKGAALGADEPSFSDAGWRNVTLPHDWSIEDLAGTSSPFSIGALSQVSGGFTTGGTGWYRKWFTPTPAQKGKRLVLQFDGVYMNAEVYLNGKRLGRHPYGYTSFYFDLTERLRWDTANVVAVRVRNEGENSRWYAGSGIYRHVWLHTLSPVHIAQWGTFVTTPQVSAAKAQVQVATTIQNEDKQVAQLMVRTVLRNAAGAVVGTTESKLRLDNGDTAVCAQQLAVNKPALWSVDAPGMYSAETEVYRDGVMVDRLSTPFGIRSIAFNAQQGFLLNGQPLKLKGGCVHHDNGPLGARAYDRAEERRVQLLKAAGYNAIRCAHNPPSPAFLDACDRLGMLVIDEAFDTWKSPKNPQDYSQFFNEWWQQDIRSMVLRDRNHPSIIMWSTGNEIPNRERPEVAALSQELTNYIRTLDTTRAVTCGVNGVEPNKDKLFATMDVAGYNYARDKYVPDHQRVPNRVMYASESFPIEALAYWKEVEANPFVIGDFVWTAFDYIGEASIGWLGYPQHQGFYPWNLAYCGDIDICGWKRPQSYYRDALWKKDQLSLFVQAPRPSFTPNDNKVDWSHWEWHDVVDSWNWDGYEGKPLEVVAYSSCDEVELFLDGVSLGRKPAGRSVELTTRYTVPWKAGKLEAIGYSKGRRVAQSVLQTAAKPAAIFLHADRPVLQKDNQDLAYITVTLTDDKGVRHPLADSFLQFELEGDGKILAVGNADPQSTESMQRPQRKAWRGRCLVIIEAGKTAGNLTLKAKAQGLPVASVVLEVK